MNLNKIKNQILENILNEKERKNVSTVAKELNIDLDVCYKASYEISIDGYVDFDNCTTVDGKDATIKINGIGKLFFPKERY